MNQPKKNSINVPSLDQSSSAAVKLTVAEAPILKEVKVPEFGDDDGGGDDPIDEVHIVIADNGYMATFIDLFGGQDRHIFLSKEDLMKMLGQRL